MFTHSQGNTPIRARARATFLRSQTLTGSHSRQCEYSAHILRLGNSDMVVKVLALFPFTFFAIKFFEVPMWSTRLSHPKVSNLRK